VLRESDSGRKDGTNQKRPARPSWLPSPKIGRAHV